MVVMFADLAGYTALADVHGDAEAVAAVDSFNSVVARVAEDHGLSVIKGIGDAFLLAGEDATSAMAAAREIVAAMGGIERAPAVRIGIHAGPVAIRGGDIFGRTVNVAARVAGEAEAGRVLITRDVLAEGPVPDEIEPLNVGTRTLRNVSAPVDLFDICHDHAPDKLVDPVCQMLVSPDVAVATLKRAGETFHFCSTDCVKRFVAARGDDPGA
jgi:adenylate cyclase